MRKVVDSNYLQKKELREYLAKSSNHYVVLTDYALMEAHKGDTLASIFKSMSILADYPRQVIVLKGTQLICGMRGRSGGLQRRLIDEKETRGFIVYGQRLRAAERGNFSLQQKLLERGRVATKHMSQVTRDAAEMPEIIGDFAKDYTAEELRILRTSSVYTDKMIDKIIRHTFYIAERAFKAHPSVTAAPKVAEIPNRFIFRSSLCAYLLVLQWISVGGAENVKPEKMRNDFIDAHFAAYATYFDGLLTADNKLRRLYEEATLLLKETFI